MEKQKKQTKKVMDTRKKMVLEKRSTHERYNMEKAVEDLLDTGTLRVKNTRKRQTPFPYSAKGMFLYNTLLMYLMYIGTE